MWEKVQWIRVPAEELERKRIFHGDAGGRFAYFRCEQELPDGAALTMNITAVSRYRLWVNGQAVLSGPCKGDLNRQYFETVELTPYLRSGRNVFAAQVLYNDPDIAGHQTDERASIYGVVGAGRCHALAAEGEILDAAGRKAGTVTTGEAPWKVWLDGSFYLRSTEWSVYMGAAEESIDFRKSPKDWREPGFEDAEWAAARSAGPIVPDKTSRQVGLVQRINVVPREIPLMEETETAFARIIRRETDTVLDAGVHVNGYPRFVFEGAAGTRIRMIYMERFGDGTGAARIDDPDNGIAGGRTDEIILDGGRVHYEPFWVRTFRFIVIQTEGGAAEMPEAPVFRKTGYPLVTESEVSSSAPWVGAVWDICLRTLRICMLETYMDCPGYEQLQFIMDTRLQMLFSYAVSGDTRLARKALLDFHCGMLPEGLLPGKTPSAYCQVISTFSLHYAYALWEYAAHTGDLQTAREYRPDIDRILDYYDRQLDETGMVGKIRPWAFIDWQDEWADSFGSTPAYFSGESSIISLMYAWALECGAKLYEATGRPGTAEEYRQRRAALLSRVRELCWDEKAGMVREGPGCALFSRHAQAWAVLNGMLSEEEGRTALRNALQCPPCSFAASYEWFRALEKAGMEAEIRQSLDAWIRLPERGSTTCPEEPGHPRSECHAWSALPLYEFMRTLAGVRPEGGVILIQPRLFDLPDLRGTAATPAGSVRFDYRRDGDGRRTYAVTLPEGAAGRFVSPGGKQIDFSGELRITE